jgi:hypothetical protein
MKGPFKVVSTVWLAVCLSVAALPPAGAHPANVIAEQKPGTMFDFVRAVLPSAANDFVALRRTKIELDLSDTEFARYTLRLADAICYKCTVADYYGKGAQLESWSMLNFYMEDGAELLQPSYVYGFAAAASPSPSPVSSVTPGTEVPPPFPRVSPQPEWPLEKTETYVKAQLSPLLAGFSLTKATTIGPTGESIPRLIWRGPRHVWVKADLYPVTAYGFIKVAVRVGHDLTHSTHVLRPATKAQIEQLRAGVRRFIRVAVSAAARDFAGLRGAEIDRSEHQYAVTMSFAPAFRSCEILDIAARVGASWDPKSIGRWDLSCGTVPTLGSRASEEDIVRSAISAALPRGFYPVSVAKHYEDDYRWQDGKGLIVELDRGSLSAEIVSFHFSIRR